MDPDMIEIFKFVGTVLPYVAMIVAVSVAGWAFTTWLQDQERLSAGKLLGHADPSRARTRKPWNGSSS